MKLKTILIIFNSLIVAAFAAVVALPAIFLGWSYTQLFWADSWYLIALFVVVFISLNVYFYRNWRLFMALEREDWSAVISVIEKRVERNLSLTASNIRLLANAYLVTGQPERITHIERLARERRPDVVRRNALLFGVPHLLTGDGARIAAFFGEFSDSAPAKDLPMVRWALAFGLLLDGESQRGRQVLQEQLGRLEPGLALALSAYLLHVHAGDEGAAAQAVADARSRVRARFTPDAWRTYVDRERTELHYLVLTKLLADVQSWLFDGQEKAESR